MSRRVLIAYTDMPRAHGLRDNMPRLTKNNTNVP